MSNECTCRIIQDSFQVLNGNARAKRLAQMYNLLIFRFSLACSQIQMANDHLYKPRLGRAVLDFHN
ncbi:hypothetical protein T01_994, partial [Trichinella spiralis]